MKLKLYTIRDNTANSCMGVWEAPNDLVAIRNFAETASQKDKDGKPANNVAKYPKEFDLYSLGVFDNETGELTPEFTKLQNAETYATKEQTKCN